MRQRTTIIPKGSSTRRGLNRYVSKQGRALYRATRDQAGAFEHERIDESCYLIQWFSHAGWDFALVTKRFQIDREQSQIIEPVSGQYIAKVDSLGEARRVISDKMKILGGIDGLRRTIDTVVNQGCLSPSHDLIQFQVIQMQNAN